MEHMTRTQKMEKVVYHLEEALKYMEDPQDYTEQINMLGIVKKMLALSNNLDASLEKIG